MNPTLTGPPRTGPFSAAAVPSPASAGTPATAFRKFRRPIVCCSGVSCTWRLVESAAFYSPRSHGGHREFVATETRRTRRQTIGRIGPRGPSNSFSVLSAPPVAENLRGGSGVDDGAHVTA